MQYCEFGFVLNSRALCDRLVFRPSGTREKQGRALKLQLTTDNADLTFTQWVGLMVCPENAPNPPHFRPSLPQNVWSAVVCGMAQM